MAEIVPIDPAVMKAKVKDYWPNICLFIKGAQAEWRYDITLGPEGNFAPLLSKNSFTSAIEATKGLETFLEEVITDDRKKQISLVVESVKQTQKAYVYDIIRKLTATPPKFTIWKDKNPPLKVKITERIPIPPPAMVKALRARKNKGKKK
jgi:hypothetical protein